VHVAYVIDFHHWQWISKCRKRRQIYCAARLAAATKQVEI